MLEQADLYQKQLGVAQWYVAHKILLQKITIILLIIFSVALFVYDINLLVSNLFIRQQDYQSSLLSLVQVNNDFSRLRQFNLPQAIQIGQIETLANRDKTDIMVEISNVNQKWWATFNYQFKIGQATTELRQGFILPGERKELMDLSLEQSDPVTELVLINIQWQKEINFMDIYQTTYNLEVKNIEYVSVKELGLGAEVPVSRVNFEVDNLSAYNYRNINFLILLDSDGQTVAINNVTSGNLLSGQSKKIEVNFFQQLPKISGVKVVPEINILDQTSFLSI